MMMMVMKVLLLRGFVLLDLGDRESRGFSDRLGQFESLPPPKE
jgi:hypothetical protein